MVFRLLLFLILIMIIYLLYSHYNRIRFSPSYWKMLFKQKIIQEPLQYIRILRSTFLLVILCFTLLAITGFLPLLVFGSPISGIALIVHVTIAPVFVLSFTLLIVLIVHQMRYNIDDWQYIKGEGKKSDPSNNKFWEKTHFWIFFISVIFAIISIMLMLYPLFGTEGQEVLLVLHRYSTFILLLVSLHYFYISLRIAEME